MDEFSTQHFFSVLPKFWFDVTIALNFDAETNEPIFSAVAFIKCFNEFSISHAETFRARMKPFFRNALFRECRVCPSMTKRRDCAGIEDEPEALTNHYGTREKGVADANRDTIRTSLSGEVLTWVDLFRRCDRNNSEVNGVALAS